MTDLEITLPATQKQTNQRHKTLVVVNRLSGTVRSLGIDKVRDILDKGFHKNSESVDIELVEGDELGQLVDQAIADPEMARIVVGGGDGTLSTVAAKLQGTDIALGILPLGTMNLFSLANGISPDLATAVDQLADPQIEKIDLGEVNGQKFLRQISLGLQPHVVRERENIGYRSRLTKKLSGIRALLIVLSRLQNLHFDVLADGREVKFFSPALYISNNKFAPGFLPYQAEINAGIIAVYAFRSTRLIDLLKMSPYILRGTWWESPNVDTLCAKELVLHSAVNRKIRRKRRKILASIDGELKKLYLPLTIRSLPSALNVLQANTQK